MSRKTEKIITFLLWLSIGTSIYFNNTFDIRFIFGIFSLSIISFCLLTKKYDLSLTVLFFTLIISSFNIILFSKAFGANFGPISLLPFLLLIILTFSRRNELLDLKDKWFEVDQIEITKSQENKIEMFKREFQNLSSEELLTRNEKYNLVDEAKIAIDLILKERDSTNKFTV